MKLHSNNDGDENKKKFYKNEKIRIRLLVICSECVRDNTILMVFF